MPDHITTYVLVDPGFEEMTEECDTPQAARNLLSTQEWEPEVAAAVRVVRKIYVFDYYEEIDDG